jgi:hypothetical protein
MFFATRWASRSGSASMTQRVERVALIVHTPVGGNQHLIDAAGRPREHNLRQVGVGRAYRPAGRRYVCGGERSSQYLEVRIVRTDCDRLGRPPRCAERAQHKGLRCFDRDWANARRHRGLRAVEAPHGDAAQQTGRLRPKRSARDVASTRSTGRSGGRYAARRATSSDQRDESQTPYESTHAYLDAARTSRVPHRSA